MILFPAMMVGGHLLIAVADRPPDLNFEPICRESAGESPRGENDSAICMNDETAAREELAKKWTEFESADRARCVRLSTTNRSGSYVEVLTCLEMDRDAKKLHQSGDAAMDLGEPAPPHAREKVSPPVPGIRAERQPVSRPPPEPAPVTGLLQIFCLPGLKSILPACVSSGGPQ